VVLGRHLLMTGLQGLIRRERDFRSLAGTAGKIGVGVSWLDDAICHEVFQPVR
jgi:hypothetical protein